MCKCVLSLWAPDPRPGRRPCGSSRGTCKPQGGRVCVPWVRLQGRQGGWLVAAAA